MLVHGSVLLDDVRPQSQGQRAGQFDRFAFSHWSNLLFDDAGAQNLDQLVGGVRGARFPTPDGGEGCPAHAGQLRQLLLVDVLAGQSRRKGYSVNSHLFHLHP